MNTAALPSDILTARKVSVDPTLPRPAWAVVADVQRAITAREHHRSRARVCWLTAIGLRRYAREHAWHMSQDDIDATLEQAGDLRKEAAAHVRKSKGSI